MAELRPTSSFAYSSSAGWRGVQASSGTDYRGTDRASGRSPGVLFVASEQQQQEQNPKDQDRGEDRRVQRVDPPPLLDFGFVRFAHWLDRCLPETFAERPVAHFSMVGAHCCVDVWT